MKLTSVVIRLMLGLTAVVVSACDGSGSETRSDGSAGSAGSGGLGAGGSGAAGGAAGGGEVSCESSSGESEVLGRWDFGRTFDVTVKDGYLYLAAGEQIRVYDITTQEKLLGLAWEQTDQPESDARIGTFVERTPPIAVLHAGNRLINGVQFDGDHLYIASGEGLLIADVAEPAASHIVGSLPDHGGTDVVVSNGYAYVAHSGAGIEVVDVSDPTSPVLVTTVELAGYNRPWRLDVSDNRLYVATETDQRLDVLDLADPASPTLIGSAAAGAESLSSYSGVAVSGGYAYVAEYHWGLRVFDVSGDGDPVEVTQIIGTANQYNYNDLKLVGDTLYASERYQGFDIIDVQNPSAPAVVSHASLQAQDQAGYTEGIFVSQLPYGSFAFVATNSLGLGVVNVDDPTDPTYAVKVITPGGGDSVAVQGNYAYIGAHNWGAWVVDVSDCRHPKEVALLSNVGRNTGVAVSGDYLYIAGSWSCLSVADISDPIHPRIVNYHYGSAIGGSLVADGTYLYNGGLRIYDVSDPLSPSVVFQGDLGLGDGHSVSALFRDHYLLGGGSNGFFVIDVSDKENPVVAGSVPGISLYAGDVAVVGEIAFVGSDNNNLQAFDLSDPTAPVALGERLVLTGTNSIVALGERAYALPRSLSWGFDVVDTSDPDSLSALATLSIAGEDMATGGGLLYTASGHVIAQQP